MNERIIDRSPLRSPATLPSLLGIAALSILSATPPVGASGGNIDNDSPYNMPTIGDSAGGNSGGGGSAKAFAPPQVDPNGRYSNGAISMIVPEVEVGGVFTLVDKLASRPFVVVPGSKVAPPGAGDLAGSVVALTVPSGEEVVARDSSPYTGDDTVEVQGSFRIQGATQLFVSPNKQFMPTTGFLLIGDASGYSPNGLMPQIDQIIPLGPSGPVIDVAAIASAVAKVPQLLGRDAQILVGHKKWSPLVGPTFHVDATVDFVVATRPNFAVDTEPELDL